MVWNRFPRYTDGNPRAGHWGPLAELERLQSEFARLFEGARPLLGRRESPPVRISTSDEGALLVALLPGFDPDAIDLSVTGDTVTLKAERPATADEEGTTWHRRERAGGSFVRSFTLPFELEAERVEATYRNGVLEATLPRSEAQKPKKIAVTAS